MPRPKKVVTDELLPISIRLPASMKIEIEKIAEEEDRSINQVVVRLLRLALETSKRGQLSKDG